MKKVDIELFSKSKFLSKLKHRDNYLSYVVSEAVMSTNEYTSSIYLYDLFKKTHRRLTTGTKDGNYIWLNDEEILFVSSRNKPKDKIVETTLYKINIHGGEAEQYITIPYRVSKMLVNEGILYCIAGYHEDAKKVHELEGHEKEDYIKALKEEDDYDVITEIPFWSNGGTFTKGGRRILVSYDLKSGDIKELTESPFDVADIYIDENFNQLFVIGKAFEGMREITNEIYLYQDGLKKLYEGEFGFRRIIQTDKDQLIVTGTDHKTYGLNENPKFYKLSDGKLDLLTPDLKLAMSNSVGTDLRYGTGMSPLYKDEKGIYYPILNGFRSEIHCLSEKTECVLSLPGSLDEYVCVNGRFYGIGLFGKNLSELYDLTDMTCLSEYNNEVIDNHSWLPVEHFNYTNRAGMDMDGFIIIPENPSDKMPTILDIHGGPKTVYGDILYHEMQYWANEGYVVIFTNPRGSDGRDNAFADIRGKYGTIDYEDIMDFVDAAIEKYPVIDSEKMGVTGGSYGGFMTNWIIGHTNRFKAAATQRSISNWVSFFGTSDIGYFFGEDQNAATPWSNHDLMWKQSPIKYAENFKTPTLIIHSHEDYRCWTPDAYQMFTALKFFSVDSKMVVFKGENHELSRGGKPKHRVRRLKEITEWMDAYLK
ncbi:S9 family peptidase [Acidaminobacter sp. JC074]|uniref:alpha/beta hydrolase family protein n=1 Tax=Acidaminobacter sp. JC074 TaxID=2530199 RepID=UPI001F100476|nr:S9 family peptidase [Acidaminobacter sp. JC074]MCH4888636.1 S9 family peptidase [Acidaminobacter sp. JC074]